MSCEKAKLLLHCKRESAVNAKKSLEIEAPAEPRMGIGRVSYIQLNL